MSEYQATIPPPGAACSEDGCCSVAVVRVTVSLARRTADVMPGNGQQPAAWDTCELHWPRFRYACVRGGHAIADASGDPAQLKADFPAWRLWTSVDAGRLYATARTPGGQGTTVHACLVGQLRAQIEQAMEGVGAGRA